MSSMALAQSNGAGEGREVVQRADGLEVPVLGAEVLGGELDLLGEDVHPELAAEASLVSEGEQASREAADVQQGEARARGKRIEHPTELEQVPGPADRVTALHHPVVVPDRDRRELLARFAHCCTRWKIQLDSRGFGGGALKRCQKSSGRVASGPVTPRSTAS